MSKDKSPFEKIVEIPAPTYKNTTPVMNIGGVELYMWDVVKVSLAARLNIGLGGGAGGGKSQLFADVSGVFGNNLTYVLGRNGTDITSFYKQLNFGKLKNAMDTGGTVAQKDITEITDTLSRPITLVEEINRAAEIVQNQYFNVFEGFIELDGVKYPLGGGTLQSFTDLDGAVVAQNTNYSVGMWTANFGNGQYTGTVTMDKGLKERSHMIIDVDNFYPGSANPSDLDSILHKSGGEIRLKDTINPEDNTQCFIDAYKHMKQNAYTPNPLKFGQELLFFRYLVLGLDHIPIETAKNSKRIMKEVWPSKAGEEKIGSGDEKLLYRMVFPASVRSGMTTIALARSLREYVKAKDPKANPTVLDSVVESFKLVAPYGGMIEYPHMVKEEFVGNNYLAASKVGEIIKARLMQKSDLINAISVVTADNKPYTKEMLDECTGEFACFR